VVWLLTPVLLVLLLLLMMNILPLMAADLLKETKTIRK
jgi:hypothetical protein